MTGDVSSELLPHLGYKADLVKKLGSSYTARFTPAQCLRHKQDGLYSIHCFTNQSIDLNGVTFPRGLSFHASKKDVTSLDCIAGKCSPITDEQVTVGVEVGVATTYGIQWLDLARTFAGEDCKIDDGFWK
jgi:hypothetical protein